MSATTTAPAPTPKPIILGATEAINQSSSVSTLRANLETAVANGATDVPAAVKAISVLDPDLAPKALIASKSPLGTVIGLGVGWFVAHEGMACTVATVAASNCWSQSTIDTVSGIGAIVGTAIGAYIMRYMTTARIGGIVSATPLPAARGAVGA
jgi:hypothetical protein